MLVDYSVDCLVEQKVGNWAGLSVEPSVAQMVEKWAEPKVGSWVGSWVVQMAGQ